MVGLVRKCVPLLLAFRPHDQAVRLALHVEVAHGRILGRRGFSDISTKGKSLYSSHIFFPQPTKFGDTNGANFLAATDKRTCVFSVVVVVVVESAFLPV